MLHRDQSRAALERAVSDRRQAARQLQRLQGGAAGKGALVNLRQPVRQGHGFQSGAAFKRTAQNSPYAVAQVRPLHTGASLEDAAIDDGISPPWDGDGLQLGAVPEGGPVNHHPLRPVCFIPEDDLLQIGAAVKGMTVDLSKRRGKTDGPHHLVSFKRIVVNRSHTVRNHNVHRRCGSLIKALHVLGIFPYDF